MVPARRILSKRSAKFSGFGVNLKESNPQGLKVYLDVETPPRSLSETAKRDLVTKRGTTSAIGWTILFFVVSWVAFYGLSRALPYLKNGSDVVFDAKLQWEEKGQVFPADPAVIRVLIFGNSKILAGFLPSRFDQISSANHLNVVVLQFRFPGKRSVFAAAQSHVRTRPGSSRPASHAPVE